MPQSASGLKMRDLVNLSEESKGSIFFNNFAVGAAVEEIWEDIARDLKNHGVGIGCVNKNIDPQLARLLGVRRFPDFVAVINGKLYHYSGAVSVENLKKFVSELFSTYHLVPEVMYPVHLVQKIVG